MFAEIARNDLNIVNKDADTKKDTHVCKHKLSKSLDL